jgi:hypothetical protein
MAAISKRHPEVLARIRAFTPVFAGEHLRVTKQRCNVN